MFVSLQLIRLNNLKLHYFKSSGGMYNSYNKNIYHPKLACYADRSSTLADINRQSYHLIAFELINPLLYIYFPSSECRIFLKDLKSKLPLSVAL